MDATECGAACLAMVLGFHGHHISVRECREQCGIGRDGTTADVLARTARSYGLGVRAMTLPGADLQGVALPAIAHWNFAHFVVVERHTSRTVDVVDPEAGRRRLSQAEFDAAFTGVVLTFQPGLGFATKQAARVKSWGFHLVDLMRGAGVGRLMGQLLLLSAALQALGLGLPLLTQVALDSVLPQANAGGVRLAGAAMLCFALAQLSAGWLRSQMLLFIEARLDLTMMPAFLQHLLSLPVQFFQQHRSGDLLMRLGNHVVLRDALAHQTLAMVLDSAMLITYGTVLFFGEPTIAAAIMALAGLQIGVYALANGPLRRLTEREVGALAQSQSYVTEMLNAIVTVKACAGEQRLITAWSALFNTYRAAALERSRLSAVVEHTSLGLRMLAPVVLLSIGMDRVLAGTLSAGHLVALNMIAASLLVPLHSLLAASQRLLLASSHFERIMDVRSTRPEQASATGLIEPRLAGRIEMRNVTFRYDPNSAAVLREVTLTIEPGEKVALVGRSGGGKTTLAHLLLGLYPVVTGEIFYDGLPAARIDRRTLRRQFGVVPQDASLFNGSVRQNIALFDADVTLAEIVCAAQIAQVHDDIMAMPMGYETRLADGGGGLSGGQRQRICIARALVRRPTVLLLDEATSHLDTATERALDDALDRMACTRIVIAHRLSTIVNADQIVVIDGGRIDDCGTHQDLLGRCLVYADLVRPQEASGRAGQRGSDHERRIAQDPAQPARPRAALHCAD
jgi:ABC-type bacteriocin/lantibiotic exporter with double-glycine peptidase domain